MSATVIMTVAQHDALKAAIRDCEDARDRLATNPRDAAARDDLTACRARLLDLTASIRVADPVAPLTRTQRAAVEAARRRAARRDRVKVAAVVIGVPALIVLSKVAEVMSR